MGKCKFCSKEIQGTIGKRKKEFCNNTCRSNYWYSKNKKSETSDDVINVKDLNRPTGLLEPPERPKTNYSINTMPKLSKVEIEALKQKYVEERRECNGAEDYLDWLKRVESDERLSNTDKDLVKNTH